MKDSKYVTFKIGDFLDAYETLNKIPDTDEAIRKLNRAKVNDAVVIRRQDVFAPPALEAYANSILAGIEVAKKYVTDVDDTRIADLLKVADYFHGQAELAYIESHRKLPD